MFQDGYCTTNQIWLHGLWIPNQPDTRCLPWISVDFSSRWSLFRATKRRATKRKIFWPGWLRFGPCCIQHHGPVRQRRAAIEERQTDSASALKTWTWVRTQCCRVCGAGKGLSDPVTITRSILHGYRLILTSLLGISTFTGPCGPNMIGS